MATQISAFFLFLLLPSPVLVHGQSYYSQSSDQSNLYKTNFSSTVAVIIVVMISAFFSMVFFSLYLRRCAEPQSVDNRTHPSAGSRTRRKGLDKAVVDSFPMMVYSEVKELKYGKGTLECAVCLCEFDDAETLRLLPKCNHAFHPDCIGMWLDSHATCPVCRADLASGEASSEDPPAHVEITVEGEGQEEEEAGDVGRRAWSEEERERFTLRLPEGVREEVMARRLDRSATMAVTGRGLTKGGRGGWSFKKEWAAKSDRWAILGRTLSLRTPRESRRGEGSGVCRDEGESSSAATGGKDRKV